jgi:hypothetical protein
VGNPFIASANLDNQGHHCFSDKGVYRKKLKRAEKKKYSKWPYGEQHTMHI